VTRVIALEAGWKRKGLARAAVYAALALCTGAVLGYFVSHEPGPQRRGGAGSAGNGSASADPGASHPHASDTELALVAPLHEGSNLAGFEIAEIDPVTGSGLLRLVCRQGGATVRLDVGLAAAGSPPPPATAGRYAVFYGVEHASAADGERLALALSAILQANASAPTPQGMGPFVLP
jgi:hypothetical protein